MSENFDVAVIGGGPGGYVAAIRLAQLGKKTVLIEKEHIGGVCLNWGCIPTKSLLKSAEILEYIKHAADYGIIVPSYSLDFKKIIARSRNVASNLTKGIHHLLKKNNVKIIESTAVLGNKGEIKLTDKTGQESLIKAKNIILATGARPKSIPGFEVDKKFIWSAKEAMSPEELPKSIIIIGSGAIGMEFASFYNSLGTKVTVIEIQDRILSNEDAEISGLALKSFEKKGIKFLLNSKILSKDIKGNIISLKIEHAGQTQNLEAEKLLIAIGIIGNTENLGLNATKIKVESGQILTNQFMQTDDPLIYAIGDVTEGPWLAHKASHEAMIAAAHIAGGTPHPINKLNIPGCTYSSPQIASVGLSEAAAKSLGYELKIGRFPFAANGKAQVLGEATGLIKTIFDAKTGELLGAHLIGPEVTELISNFVIAKNLETTEQELMDTIFPHPTLSEGLHESVLEAFKRAIHI